MRFLIDNLLPPAVAAELSNAGLTPVRIVRTENPSNPETDS